MASKHRLFVGGLFDGAVADDLKNRFSNFGEVSNIDVREKRDLDGNISNTFAYIDLSTEEQNLKRCMSALNRSKWRGKELVIQQAKESFLDRLKREQKDKESTSEPTPKKRKPKQSSDKNVIIGTPAPKVTKPDHSKWVRGKAGKLVPVLKIRKSGHKQLVKNDPSKHIQQIKKLDVGKESGVPSKSVEKLTWNFPEMENSQAFSSSNSDSNSENETTKKNGDNFVSEFVSVKNSTIDVRELKDETSSIGSESDSPDNQHFVQSEQTPVTKKNKPTSQQLDQTSKETTSPEDKLADNQIEYCSDDSESGNDGYFVGYKKFSKSSFLQKDKRPAAGFICGNTAVLEDSGMMSREQEDSSSDTSDSDDDILDLVETGDWRRLEQLQNMKSQRKDDLFTAVKPKVSSTQKKATKNQVDVIGSIKKLSAKGKESLSDLESSTSESSGDEFFSCTESPFSVKKQNSMHDEAEIEIKNSKEMNGEHSSDSESDVPDVGSLVEKFKVSERMETKEKSGESRQYSSESDSSEGGDFVGMKKPSNQSKHLGKNRSLSVDSSSQLEFSAGMTKCNQSKLSTSEQSDSSDLSETSDSEEDDILDTIAAGNWKKITELEKGTKTNRKSGKTRNRILTAAEADSSPSKERKQSVNNGGLAESMTSKLVATEKLSSSASKQDSAGNKGDDNQKQAVSNVQRLKSLKERKKQTESQKMLIQKALSSVDSCRSNKITFDSDEASSEEEEVEDLKSPGQNKTEDVKSSTKLFEEDSDGSESDDTRFQIKPQFEGKQGGKMIALQSRFGDDKRFKLDKRFAQSESDSDSESESNEVEIKEKSEKQKNLNILESVLGKKLKAEAKKQKFVDMNTVRYDPLNPEHKHFEMQTSSQPSVKTKEENTKKAKVAEAPSHSLPPPEISKDRSYTVGSSLQQMLKKKAAEEVPNEDDHDDTKETKGFSLLAMFGSNQDDSKREEVAENEGVKWTPLPASTTGLWQTHDDSTDEENMDQETENVTAEILDDKPSLPDTFFFTVNDPRITEGLEFFRRQESVEEYRAKWEEKRPELIECYKQKHKRAIRKKRAEYQFNMKKRKKFFHKKK